MTFYYYIRKEDQDRHYDRNVLGKTLNYRFKIIIKEIWTVDKKIILQSGI